MPLAQMTVTLHFEPKTKIIAVIAFVLRKKPRSGGLADFGFKTEPQRDFSAVHLVRVLR